MLDCTKEILNGFGNLEFLNGPAFEPFIVYTRQAYRSKLKRQSSAKEETVKDVNVTEKEMRGMLVAPKRSGGVW